MEVFRRCLTGLAFSFFAHVKWITERVSSFDQIMLDEIRVELAEQGAEIHGATVGRSFLGPAEQHRQASQRRVTSRSCVETLLQQNVGADNLH